MSTGRTTGASSRFTRAIAEALESRHLLAGTLCTVNSLADTVAADGVLTLREAAQAASTNLAVNEAPAGSALDTDIIRFDPALFASGSGTIRLNGSELPLAGDLSIEGPGSAKLSIDGDAQSRIFNIAVSAKVSISGLTLTGGSAADGGAIYNSSSLKLSNCTFSENSASNYGGAIYTALDSSTILTNCTFSENSAVSGGGMYTFDSSSATLSNCTFTGNSASNSGGGMFNFYSVPTLTDCTFSGNTASHGGGGIHNQRAKPVTVANCTFSGNTAASGGGLNNSDFADVTLTNCTFSGNTAGIGGGLENYEGARATLTDCTFSGNAASGASGNGGGMRNRFLSYATLTNCIFSGNTASYIGGAMNSSESTSILSNCTFTRNSAEHGGGMGNNFCSPRLTNCTFDGNSAAHTGGGIYGYESEPILANCVFSGNTAVDGGGIAIEDAFTPILNNCTFSGNSASNRGGGLFSGGAPSPQVNNSIFWGNTAPTGAQIHNAGTITVSYSDIQGGGYIGTGNIDADPLFVRSPSPGLDGIWGTADDDYGDLRLCGASPCINAGSNALAVDPGGDPLLVDVAGQQRFQGGTVDVGAYEYQPQLLPINGRLLRDLIELWSDDYSFYCRINSGPTLSMPRSLVTAIRIDAQGGDALSFDLDLQKTDLLVQSDPASRDQFLKSISQAIASKSLRTSQADGLHGLAAILNQDSQGKRLYDTFAESSVDASSILLKLTWNGDADLNGILDGSDYFFIDKGYLSRNLPNPPTGYRNGDFDYNGMIDGSDYFLIDKAFLSQRSTPPAAATLSDVASPSSTVKKLLHHKRVPRRFQPVISIHRQTAR